MRGLAPQRDFATFPRGLPGLGLLLLRATAAADLTWSGVARWMAFDHTGAASTAVATLAVASGILLALGHLTRLTAILAVISRLGIALSVSRVGLYVADAGLDSVFTIVIAVALFCLGPGAFSIDGLRYGLREIHIPPFSDTSSKE